MAIDGSSTLRRLGLQFTGQPRSWVACPARRRPSPPASATCGSSPVREILELTAARRRSSPSPAACRRPSCSPPRWSRGAFATRARADRRRPRAAVLHDRGRPRAARAAGRALRAAAACARRRRAARHDRLAAGARPRRARPARPRRRGARREPVLPRGAAVLRLRGRAARAGAVRRGGPRSRGAAGADRRARAEVPLPRADVPEPDRPHAARRAARAPRRGRRRARPVDRRGRPLRRAALRRRAAGADRLLRRRRATARSACRRCRRCSRPACGSAACARPRRCSARWRRQAGGRPAHLDGRPARGRPHLLQTASLDAHIAAHLRASTAAAATRCSAGWPPRCPAGSHVQPARRRDVRLGAAAGGLGRRARCCARRSTHDVAFVPGAPFYAGDPDPRTLRLSFTTHPPAEIAEGLARLRATERRLTRAVGASAHGGPPGRPRSRPRRSRLSRARRGGAAPTTSGGCAPAPPTPGRTRSRLGRDPARIPNSRLASSR